jgi:hypothetical protein
VNNVNEYTQRTVPGSFDLIGAANSSATVSVNVQPTRRKGAYFRAEYQLDNTTSAVYQPLTNVAVLRNGGGPDIIVTNQGFMLVPQTPEVFVYDTDGNLATNGRKRHA